MCEDEKKFILGFLGCSIVDGVTGKYIYQGERYIGEYNKFNPDIQHFQFALIWKRLNKDIKDRIKESFSSEGVNMEDAILYNLPEVLRRIVDEIKKELG